MDCLTTPIGLFFSLLTAAGVCAHGLRLRHPEVRRNEPFQGFRACRGFLGFKGLQVQGLRGLRPFRV